MDNSLDQIREFRLKKMEELRSRGIDPFPAKSSRTTTIGYFVEKFDKFNELAKPQILVGRLMARRTFGALTFGLLRDGYGEVQVLWKKDNLGEDVYSELGLVDIGDILQVSGLPMLTQKGEKTLLVEKTVMLAKSLRPLPDKWHGITDQETRYRQRYLDLLMNSEVKRRFEIRHDLVQAIRNYLIGQGFWEVDTPAIQSLAGGALATPFKTYYEAIDAEAYLRIAPELYLKRLVVGGFERVFEFARVFRNEGVSTQHLQDFTMLEFYQAYADYEDLMKMTEEMLVLAVGKALGTTKFDYQGKTIDMATPWLRKSFRDLILEHTHIDIDNHPTVDSLQAQIRSKGIRLNFAGTAGRGKLIDELYKETVRPNLINPVFLIDHPLDLSPLAKKKEDDPDKVQRFQLVVAGMEIVNAFSELNDPLDQKERFDEQARLKGEGDVEAHSADDDFVKALEYGMPPTAGWGMGIDRLVALVTNADTIREAVLFPFVKDRN